MLNLCSPSLFPLPGEDRFVLVGKKKKGESSQKRRQAVKIINRKAYVVPRVCVGGKAGEERERETKLSGGGKEWRGETEEGSLKRRRERKGPGLEFRHGARNIGQAGWEKRKGVCPGRDLPRTRQNACTRVHVIPRMDRRTDGRTRCTVPWIHYGQFWDGRSKKAPYYSPSLSRYKKLF